MSFAETQIAKLEQLRQLCHLKLQLKEQKKLKRARKRWVKPLLLRKNEHSLEAHLLEDLLDDGAKDFKNFTRLSLEKFEEILHLVNERLRKEDTVFRDAITPRTKLAITLRYLATGNSYKSLEFLSRVSKSTISLFVPDVLRAVYETLQPKYLKVPDTTDEWLDIASDFQRIWQFPHTLGALDGKHIRMKAPAKSGSQYYNFKGFYSIILFALVDAHGRFIFVDVGSNGKASDSTIYRDGQLFNGLTSGALNIPGPAQLVPRQGNSIPYYFVGDDAFCLDKNLMKPYNRNLKLTVAQEMFNYRLCRARMIVECAFGRLAKRFNIFQRPIEVLPKTADLVVLACCTLHNWLTTPNNKAAVQEDLVVEYIGENFSSIGQQQHSAYKYANRIRDEVSRFCISDGDVEFQWGKVKLNRGGSSLRQST